MAYDVFISYRRLSKGVNGVHIARSLQQELKSMGLNVFFDMEELTDGKFNEKLYDAIESSKNVIFLMTEGSLDRCVNEGDWVRNELEHVIEKGVNLVPVAPTGTTIAFPKGFPAALEPMKVLEISELNLEKLFKESVAKIAGRLKDVVLVTDKDRQEAEETFLNQARRFKGNDGVIDAEERKVLGETGKELGISKARQIVLIERVEQEYSTNGENDSTRPPTGMDVCDRNSNVTSKKSGSNFSQMTAFAKCVCSVSFLVPGFTTCMLFDDGHWAVGSFGCFMNLSILTFLKADVGEGTRTRQAWWAWILMDLFYFIGCVLAMSNHWAWATLFIVFSACAVIESTEQANGKEGPPVKKKAKKCNGNAAKLLRDGSYKSYLKDNK